MKTIQYEINPEGTIGLLTINRPEARNAIDFDSQYEFANAINYFSKLPKLVVIMITGSGNAFASGADIKELQNKESREDGEKLSIIMREALEKMGNMPAITIAVINGAARGGGAEIAVACDLRYMAEEASIAFVHAKLGLIPGWGGSVRLYRLVGESKALELIVSGKAIYGREAYEMKLVNELFPQQELMENVTGIAEKIAGNQVRSVQMIKKLFKKYRVITPLEARGLEREAFLELWDTDKRRKLFKELKLNRK